MRIVRVMGGLGNQLFQYAAAHALAAVQDGEVLLDLTSFEESAKRRFQLQPYDLRLRIASARLVREARDRERLRERVLRRLIFRRRRPWVAVIEKHFQFDPSLFNAPPYSYIDGYWQSPRYFAGVEAEIRALYQPRTAPTGLNAEMLARINEVNAVSVHIRRGDYALEQSTRNVHGLCSLEYYERGLTAISGRTDALHLFVFSDDPAWTREHLRTPWPTTYVDHNGPDAPHEDLRLMSACRHHVIANSTLSWWGAWLSPAKGKIVVAPSPWFVDTNIDSSDLIPAEWVIR